MKIKEYFQGIQQRFQRPCNPQPGFWNSCEPCKGCTKRAKYPTDELPPIDWGNELREDGFNELREDGSIELREQ